MGFFKKVKKFGKKALGEVLNNVQMGAPVADFFYPGSGQYISAGANIVGKKTGLDDEGFFKETDKAADAVDKYITPIMSAYTSGGSSMLPTPQVLGANRVEGNGLGFGDIGSIIQGLGGLQDIFSGGTSGRLEDYYDAQAQANQLVVDAAGKQAEKDYALALQEHAARSAYAASSRANAARAASAKAAAARQEEENRLKAARRSLRVQKKARAGARDMYAPYVATGHRALATSESLFNAGAGMLGDIQNLINSAPSGMSLLNKVSK
jgi:hypothetical protein